jgi:hypothetical protein
VPAAARGGGPCVVADGGKGRAREPRVAVQQRAAVQRLVRPLVPIDPGRAGQRQPRKPLGHGQGRQRAVGAVDVPPRAAGVGDGGQRSEWVNGAGGDRPGRGHYRDRPPARPPVLRGRRPERVRGAPASDRRPGPGEGWRAPPQQGQRLGHRQVDLFGGVDHARLGALLVGRRPCLPRRRQAIRLADDPSLVRLPVKPPPPTAWASQPTTARSAATADGADRQAVRFWLSTDAYGSPGAPTGSPEPTTSANKRPLPARACSVTAARASNAAPPVPSSGAGPCEQRRRLRPRRPRQDGTALEGGKELRRGGGHPVRQPAEPLR